MNDILLVIINVIGIMVVLLSVVILVGNKDTPRDDDTI